MDMDALSSAVAKANLPSSAFSAARAWLAEQLVAHEYAKLGQGGHTQNQVPLRQVFVDLPVTDSLSNASVNTERTLFLEGLLSCPPVNLKQACKSRSVPIAAADHLSDETKDEDPVIDDDDDENFSSTLLIGGPGQGKSTLGQLASQLHRAALLMPFVSELTTAERDLVQSFEVPQRSPQEDRTSLTLPASASLPLQIALPDLAAWMAREQSNSGGDEPPAILRFLSDLPSAKKCGITADILLALASYMPILLVLDGFDEVGAAEDRARLVGAARDLLFLLASRGAVAHVLATTRPQGYAGELAHIGLRLRECHLCTLSREEALTYAAKLVEAKIPGLDQRNKILERLHEAAQESATQRLLTTPLQVTILTALIQQIGRAPRERWNLFFRYFSYTYDREVERQTYASRLLSEHRAHIEQIHARVALLLQLEAERAGGASARMSKDRLEEVIEAVLLEDEVSETDRQYLVKEIAVAAEQRLVFLVEPEPGSFGFEIRSLQEFMAAWALTSGRDSEVEARLIQVTRAPMFRNVVLFMASRLYSEGSPLRDFLSDTVCTILDDDPNDEAARITRAGGLLALETLEEGAVLSQPKRARALMARAAGLLDLPPGNEHPRLARAANADTQQVLSEAIERHCIDASRSDTNENYAPWVTIVEAINRGDQWAIALGDALWPKVRSPESVLRALVRVRVPLGSWIARKIEESATHVGPDSFVPASDMEPVIGQPSNWVHWLMQIYDRRKNWRRRAVPTMNSHVADGSELVDMPLSVAPSDLPPEWRAWIAAAKFETNPSAPSLAHALHTIADMLPKENWRYIEWMSSWPLAACLRCADVAADLRRFADRLLKGELGDAPEWRQAQRSWKRAMDVSVVLASAEDDPPWSLHSLAMVPPFATYPLWQLGEDFRRKKNIAPKVIVERAHQIFMTVSSAPMKRFAAEAALMMLRRLPMKEFSHTAHVSDWLAAVPDGAGYLVPRPRCLRKADWVRLLSSVPFPTRPVFYADVDEVAKAIAESAGHPLVLWIAVLVVDMQLENLHGDVAPDKLLRELQRLTLGETAGPAQRAYLNILRIAYGSTLQDSDADIVGDVSAAAQEIPSLWSAFLSALATTGIARTRAISLLAAAYARMGLGNDLAAAAIGQLRNLLQIRTSELDNLSMWNRLALPRPYPQPPRGARIGGGIPGHPIALQSIELQDIRGLHRLNLSFDAPEDGKGQWVVILGPNGVGKTTLLRSLALAVRNVRDITIWPPGVFTEPWQRVNLHGEELPIDARIRVKLSDASEYNTLIREGGPTPITQLPEQSSSTLFPVFAYGCRRGSALGGAKREVNLDAGAPEIATLFDDNAGLIHAETWLLQLEADAQKNSDSGALYSAVCNSLTRLLDTDSIQIVDRKVLVQEHGKPKLPFNALSDGYLTSAGWFLDLVARWIEIARRSGEALTSDFMTRMTGLVLIDEIDLHLHPRLQLDIIRRTRQILPKMSFIVTTHNPLTLVGAKANEIWILSSKDGRVHAERGIEAPILLSGGQIYRRYFGIDDIYPDRLGRALQRFGFLSGYAERSDEEQEELEHLTAELTESGVRPDWDVVPRAATREQQTTAKESGRGEGLNDSDC